MRHSEHLHSQVCLYNIYEFWAKVGPGNGFNTADQARSDTKHISIYWIS